ncbi:MAG: glucose 1-dehydrogenase [Bryobacterales bacterium]|nr:glucose 1-dehydrogenase [Bryobacterales bacterium]
MTEVVSLDVGAEASLRKTITTQDIAAFAQLSGDSNPLHTDAAYCARTSFQKPVAHGMLLGAYVSTLVGTRLPGPGALWAQQSFRWRAPVFSGDEIEFVIRVTHKSVSTGAVTVAVSATNQNGQTVMEGEGVVMVVEERRISAEKPLSECVALVTGASRGLGAVIARELARHGSWVAVNYLTHLDAAARICDEIASEGGHARAIRIDVRDAVDIRAGIEEITEHFGRPVDILVNNATMPPAPQPFLELSWNDLQSFFDTQVRGAFLCCQAVIPAMMRQHGGRVVNIGAALTSAAPMPHWTAFAAAKAALLSLTRSLAAEFGPSGIRVNHVSPGVVNTESTAVLPEKLRKVQAMKTPLRRLAEPSDVARAVVFLCSEQAEFITGTDLPVCGGMVA